VLPLGSTIDERSVRIVNPKVKDRTEYIAANLKCKPHPLFSSKIYELLALMQLA
jgi:hypothetical protein